MRALVLCCLVLASGCATVPEALAPREPVLCPEDLALAQALSHYARGLLAEGVEGKRSARALDEFSEAARLDPESQRIQARVAAGALVQGDTERSIAALQKLCEINPTSVVARVDLATVHQYNSQPELAEQVYREAIALDPRRTLTYWEAARSLLGAGADEAALSILEAGLLAADDPNVLLTYLNAVSVQFVRSKMVDRAIPCLELLSRHMVNRAEILNLLAEAYVSTGDEAKAESVFRKSIGLPSATVGSFVRFAMLQMGRSEADAITTLEKGREVFPEDRSVLFMLAYAYTRGKRLGEAISTFEALLACSETDGAGNLSVDFYLLYANACESSGRRDEAESIMERCVLLYPDASQALNFLAYSWAENGERLETAEAYVLRALEDEPDNGAYVDTLGWIYYQQKRYDKALEELKKASLLLADDPTVSDHLGDALNALDHTAEALIQWKRSVLIDPEQRSVREKLESHGVDVDAFLRESGEAGGTDGAANGE